MIIGVQNLSTLVTSEDVYLMALLADLQLREHVAPAWGLAPPTVVFLDKPAEFQYDAIIGVLDDADQAGDLGWHTEGPDADVYGRVFASPVLQNGGNALTNELSVCSVLSHECIETLGDSACLAPATKVLTADLRWVQIGDVLPGEFLIGFDEFSGGPGHKRQWRKTVVEATETIVKPCYDLTFEDGTQVRCSSDHQWLAMNGIGLHWVKTVGPKSGLRPLTPNPDSRGRIRAEGKICSRVYKPVDVWGSPDSYTAGYIAAALEGEGCISRDGRLTFAQRENVMLERYVRFLKEMGIEFTQSITRHASHDDVHKIYVSVNRDLLRILGETRPMRLLDKFSPEDLGSLHSATGSAPRLIEKHYVGEQEVVALRTSTHTFIAEGLASHNCNRWAQRPDGSWVAVELADPVEGDSYPVTVESSAQTVTGTLSDFVLPAWFDPDAPTGRTDWLSLVTAPFQVRDTGYVITMAAGSTAVTEQWGAKYPEWRKATKASPTARTARRDPQLTASFEAPTALA